MSIYNLTTSKESLQQRLDNILPWLMTIRFWNFFSNFPGLGFLRVDDRIKTLREMVSEQRSEQQLADYIRQNQSMIALLGDDNLDFLEKICGNNKTEPGNSRQLNALFDNNHQSRQETSDKKIIKPVKAEKPIQQPSSQIIEENNEKRILQHELSVLIHSLGSSYQEPQIEKIINFLTAENSEQSDKLQRYVKKCPVLVLQVLDKSGSQLVSALFNHLETLKNKKSSKGFSYTCNREFGAKYKILQGARTGQSFSEHQKIEAVKKFKKSFGEYMDAEEKGTIDEIVKSMFGEIRKIFNFLDRLINFFDRHNEVKQARRNKDLKQVLGLRKELDKTEFLRKAQNGEIFTISVDEIIDMFGEKDLEIRVQQLANLGINVTQRDSVNQEQLRARPRSGF